MTSLIIDCLLPNSVVVPLTCPQEIQLISLKGLLWQEAKKYPQFNTLGPSSDYVFVGITVETQQKEFGDETQRVSELNLVSPVLKLVKRKGTQEEKDIDDKIGFVIGRDLDDLKAATDEEIKSFRKLFQEVVYDAVALRQEKGMESIVLYHYPPELEPFPHLPPSVEKLLDEGFLSLNVWHDNTKCFQIRVPWDIYPEAILLQSINNASFEIESKAKNCSSKGPAEYALKICGANEYLLANRPITQYKTIRRWIAQRRIPQLLIVPRADIYSSLTKFSMPSVKCHGKRVDEKSISLWHLSIEGRLKIRILRALNVTIKNTIKVTLRVGLFHGRELLCPEVQTQPPDALSWGGEWLQMELPVQEMPRAAKMTFSLCLTEVASDRRRKRLKGEDAVVAIGSLNLFDFEDRLVHGRLVVTLHEPLRSSEGFFGPCQASGSAPEGMQLEVEFEERFSQAIYYPDDNQIYDYAKYIIRMEKAMCESSEEEVLEKMDSICRKDPCKELSAEEREFLWSHRQVCRQIPDSLPKLLKSVTWESRDSVAQLYLLLEDWPLLSPETALALLQFTCPDHKTRHHAVTSLARTLPDERLSQYMLQLIHTLKHEAYLDSPLLRFLLHKGLTNKIFGSWFFWHLRSEVGEWQDPLRVLAILEAFCRGLGADLKTLLLHVQMIEKMTKLSDAVKERKCDSIKERNKHLQQLLSESEFSEALQHLPSPLRLPLALGRLRISECRVLDSARRPILLTWDNPDSMAEHFSLSHAFIFKSGDDMRQDMLILQVISLMAHIWMSEGLDLKMTPYSCLATGNRMGLIEVVQNAETVYGIQKGARLGALQVDSSQLFKWIKDKNCGSRLEQAIETFTRSCAGYCVATFVLGIGDRHPDNIMVNEDGQIFHVDFGHFLGNFKRKFGIQRERVPFVLTLDFLKVIADGADNPKESHKFQRFQELCGKAYLALRKHSKLLISLFILLELQTTEDLSFLRKTLAVDSSEADALHYFQNKFHEAYGGAWTTKLDWFFHSMKHK